MSLKWAQGGVREPSKEKREFLIKEEGNVSTITLKNRPMTEVWEN